MPVEKREYDVFGDPVKVRHYVKNGVVHTEISGLGVDFSLPLNAGHLHRLATMFDEIERRANMMQADYNEGFYDEEEES